MVMSGKSVVVTGCGTGIGRAIALRLAADGWSVVGLELNPETGGKTRADLGAGHDVIIGDASERAVLAAIRPQRHPRARLAYNPRHVSRIGQWTGSARGTRLPDGDRRV